MLAIDVGGTKIAAAIVRRSGEILVSRSLPTPLTSADAILRCLEEVARELLTTSGVPVEAIGLGVPGVVDAISGVAVSAANLPWAHTGVTAYLSKRLGVAAFLSNDADAGALGERWFGLGRGSERFVYISVGTGVGSGIVIDGRLLPGHGGLGSEVGHMIVEIDGTLCGCGSRGCLETLAAGPPLSRRMKERCGREMSGREVAGKLIQGATTTNWKQALAQLSLAYPERINPHL